MPTIGNNVFTLLHGLSDFWQRFYADYDELLALYQGTEILMAQAYLDFLNSFLNISIAETPLFNTEYFKLVLAREDKLTYAEAAHPSLHRYVLNMPDTLMRVDILQNKIIDPTASLEIQAGYDLDTENYQFRFELDPSGRTGRTLATTTQGSLLAYGAGALTRFYVTDVTRALFAKAKPGSWIAITGSAGGLNDGTFRIAQIIDDQTALLQGTFVLPDANSGSLLATVLDAEFTPLEGFSQRTVNVQMGGSFDDATLRAATEIGSWAAASPVGLDIKKGDVVRITDRDAVPSVPTDLRVAVVRHDKLYIAADTPVPRTATNATYVILRTPHDGTVVNEPILFEEKLYTPVKTQTNGSLTNHSDGPLLSVPGGSPVKFAAADKQRFVTLSNCGPLSWPAQISAQGILTVQSGSLTTPFARAVAGGTVTLSGSSLGQDGTFLLQRVLGPTEAQLGGFFIAETGLTALLDDVTNEGTYRIKKVLSPEEVILTLPASGDDPNNGALVWRVHDGFRTTFANTRIALESVNLQATVGDSYTGGLRNVLENTDYILNYQTGDIMQVGRFAGLWGVDPLNLVPVSYLWYREVGTGTHGSLSPGDTELLVSEVAFWAPDSRVDKYHLYNNYGYLINHFAASSETYREFIRGVFQLYILGPTLKRLESALNVIAGFPVARDDAEVLQGFDNSSDALYDLVTTLRVTGDVATYKFLRPSTGSLVRADILAYTPADPDIVFEAFEPLTDAFRVTDYLDDPTWWEDIIIPLALMPSESEARRTTQPLLYENVIGAPDDPRIGDPGLYIGADDEGVVPAYGDAAPAKRRKMANVVMNLFLKLHVFHIYFNPLVYDVAPAAFLQDVQTLVAVVKPSWTYVYFGPSGL